MPTTENGMVCERVSLSLLAILTLMVKLKAHQKEKLRGFQRSRMGNMTGRPCNGKPNLFAEYRFHNDRYCYRWLDPWRCLTDSALHCH